MIERKMSKDILETAQFFPVIAVLGPRQSGKTTLVQALFPEHKYVNFEHLAMQRMAIEDPEGFLAQAGDKGMIIDEFQNVPEILSYIQLEVDASRRPGYFVLTGSQNFLMNQAISQSLAGRVSIHTLLPLSISELVQAQLLPPSPESLIYKGSYPSCYAHHISPFRWYPNYVQTYVERDVRQLKNIGDLSLFKTFLMLCAGRIGQLLNYTSLGNDCGISDNTVRQWISILEASYIIFLIYPYHKNFSKRLVKTPKLYFYDTGLACSLQTIESAEQVSVSYMRGNLFENLVIADLYKYYYNHGKAPHIYFWRDYTGHEVDCIIETGQRLISVEIKASRTMSSAFFDGLRFWNNISGQDPKNGYVIYGGDEEQQWSAGNVVSWRNVETIVSGLRTTHAV